MKKALSVILASLLLATTSLTLMSCDNGNKTKIKTYDAKSLQEAKSRYFSGKADAQDKRMVEGFYKWKASQ